MMESRVFNNAIWIILCKIVQAVLALVVSMLSARYLGPHNFGTISYAASVVAFVVPIMNLGITNILVQEIIDNKDREGETLGTTIMLSVISSIFCMMGVTAFGYLANPGEYTTIIVCALYSIMLIFQATEMIQYWFQAKLLSKYTSIVMLIAYAVVSIYKITLLILKTSVYWFAVSNAFDYMLVSIGIFICYKRFGGQKLKFSFKTAKRLFSRGKYYIVSSMMVTIFAQTDKIMLKAMINETAVGYYSAAVTCAGMTSFIFTAIIDSMRPEICEKKLFDENKYKSNLSTLYSIIIYFALFQSLGITLFSRWIIIILYGKDYMPAVSALRIVVWYTTFSYLGAVRNIWILAERKHQYLWIINLSGALANIVLNYILIPVWGVNGAAFASLVTQIFTNVIIGWIIRPIAESNHIMLKALNPKYFLRLLRTLINLKTWMRF